MNLMYNEFYSAFCRKKVRFDFLPTNELRVTCFHFGEKGRSINPTKLLFISEVGAILASKTWQFQIYRQPN